VAFGPGKFSTFTSSGPASWEGMARNLYGLFWFFVFLAIVNSTIANANAGVNVASRMSYAMGRIHAFPHAFAMTGTGVVIVLVAIYILMNRPGHLDEPAETGPAAGGEATP